MNAKTASKFLSLILRHEPHRIGVVLDAANVKSWGEVKELILESYELVKPPKVKKAARKTAPGKPTRP